MKTAGNYRNLQTLKGFCHLYKVKCFTLSLLAFYVRFKNSFSTKLSITLLLQLSLILWTYHFLQICLRNILPCCVADFVNHAEVSLCPRPQRPGLDTSLQSPWVRLKSFSFSFFPPGFSHVSVSKIVTVLAFSLSPAPELCLCGTPACRSLWPAHLLEPGLEHSPYLWTGIGPGR